MKSAVIVFPGSNCDRDAQTALTEVTGEAPAMVWHKDGELPDDVDLVVVPGGFSYGDYLRCGAMAANSPVIAGLRRHAERGGYVLGVCNGFQVLLKAGVLPGGAAGWRQTEAAPQATLTWITLAGRGLRPMIDVTPTIIWRPCSTRRSR